MTSTTMASSLNSLSPVKPTMAVKAHSSNPKQLETDYLQDKA